MESAGAPVGRLPVARKNSSMDLRAFMAKKMVASLICKKKAIVNSAGLGARRQPDPRLPPNAPLKAAALFQARYG
jgi:hypothetical protein